MGPAQLHGGGAEGAVAKGGAGPGARPPAPRHHARLRRLLRPHSLPASASTATRLGSTGAPPCLQFSRPVRSMVRVIREEATATPEVPEPASPPAETQPDLAAPGDEVKDDVGGVVEKEESKQDLKIRNLQATCEFQLVKTVSLQKTHLLSCSCVARRVRKLPAAPGPGPMRRYEPTHSPRPGYCTSGQTRSAASRRPIRPKFARQVPLSLT